MDAEAVAEVLATRLNDGIIIAAKDIGLKLFLGLAIIGVAIYTKK